MEGGDPPRLKPAMASRKLLVLAFVRDYIARWEGSPSYGEIAAGVGISRSRAKQLVDSLVKQRKLLRRPGTRGISLPSRDADAIRALRVQGWTVDEKAGIALAPGCTNPILSARPVLDYVAPSKGEARGIDRAVGRAASGTGSAGSGDRRGQ
jgi:hypothetical protein